MKKLFYLLIVSFVNSAFGLSDYTSQTYVQLRPTNQNIAMRQSLWHKLADIHEGYTQSGYQFYAFYQKSTDEQVEFAKYFTFDNKVELRVKGDSVSTTDREIRAEWLGLDAAYDGTLKLNPEQERIGGTLEFKRALSKYFKAGFFKNLWIGTNLSFEAVDNKTGVQSVGATSDNLVAQVGREDLTYGKIADTTSSVGLSESRLTLGADFKPTNRMDLGISSFVTIPGSVNKQTAKYLFEAVRGYNRHFGFGMGMHSQFPLNKEDSRCAVSFYIDGEAISFFSLNKLRVLDLKSKPWSRFLLLNKSTGSADDIAATTVLTQNVKIDPSALGEGSLGFRFNVGGFEAELGYAIWGHGSEEIELVDAFTTDYGISGSASGTSASASTIKTRAADDSSFTVIVQDDLDLKSGAARSAITHRINSSMGYVYLGKRLDVMLGLGAFYELPQNNSMLKQWGAFGKLGVFF